MSNKKSIKILTDEEENNPILGFGSISETIINIIEGSNPKFSIGIYGEWGTGKTTLMRLIEKSLLQKSEILVVWFNAWRYEREENFAITALLKTIAYAMEKHPIYKEVRPIILRSIKIITKGILSEIASKIISRETVDQLKEDLENKTLPYLDLLNEIDKDTIYFDGLHKIEDEIKKILEKPNYKSSKIVVFIDDLDRCSPLKALEVFESVKVFLDIKGFVFVIGLSHKTVSKLIEIQYEKAEIKGELYIRKIIQLPIILPEWKNIDTKDILDNLIVTDRIDSRYLDLINGNKDIIATVVEPSPREIKRFINNFIISFEIFSKNLSIQQKEFLIIQSLKFRWGNFYNIYSSDINFRRLINRLLNVEYNFIRKVMNDNDFTNYLTKVEEEGIERLVGTERLFSISEIRKDILRIKLEDENVSTYYDYESKYYKDKITEIERKLEEIEKAGGFKFPSDFVDKYPDLKIITEIEGREFSYLRTSLNEIEENKKILERDIQRNLNKPIPKISGIFSGRIKKEVERMRHERDYTHSLEERIRKRDQLIKKYISKYIIQLRTLLEDIKYNYKKNISEIDYDLWKFLIKQENILFEIKNWDVYRYAADFSKEMLNPESKININNLQDNNTKTANLASSNQDKQIEKVT